MATPGRASFAGFGGASASPSTKSPSFRDIARRIMAPEKVKAFNEVKQALVYATAMLMVVFILITIYAVNVVVVPYIKTLLLALLFGSFLHPMKRSLAESFRKTLEDIHDEMPILGGLLLPISLIDRLMQWVRRTTMNYAYTIVTSDVRSVMIVCIAAIPLAIIGGDPVINFIACLNLIVMSTDMKKSDFSDAYLHFLIRSFCMAQFCWLHPQIIYLLLIFASIWLTLSWLLSKAKARIVSYITERREAVPFHETLAQMYTSALGYYKVFIESLDDYVDTISSACVIGIVAIIVILTTIYLSLQIYVESVHLIQKASTTANELQQSNPELQSWLPDWLNVIHFLFDTAVNNIYQHGREWIKKSTKQFLINADMQNINSSQTAVIENQMIEFWDRAYELWQKNVTNSASMSYGPQDRPSSYDWDRLLVAMQSLNFTLCAQIFKENWDTLISVTSSITKVLKDNLSLAVNILTVILSLLVLWANVLINFILDLFIFTTALFYLLCASTEEYKPIELLKSFMLRTKPTLLALETDSSTALHRDEFINMVDESINAVFTASLKMMMFHGLSTWLLHMLFQLQVVYVPSVLSALFAVVPFVSPYWASVPACLDLWLSGHISQAVIMFLLATVPSSFVTTAFYSEIKGAGHPYLTGLAIAAGIVVFGIEGALFGPMLLVSIRLLPLVLIYFIDICK